MFSTWHLIERALNEASGKGALLAHIRRFKGDHEADMLAPFLDSMWNAKGLPVLAKHLTSRYGDDAMVKSIFDGEFAKLGISGRELPSRAAVMKRSGGSGDAKLIARSKPGAKKGKNKDAESELQRFRTPDQARAQAAATAATAALRPDRSPAPPAPAPSKSQLTLRPGDKAAQHDVGQSVRGTSPGHTKPAIDQPSQVIQPSKLAGQLEPLEKRARQLNITVNALQNDPAQKHKLAQAKAELASLQAKINSVKQTGSSGVEDAQRSVDKKSKTDPLGADARARALGVPTTKQRTRKMLDPKTGEEKSEVQIWDQEKVYRFMNKGGISQAGRLRVDPQLEPGVYDPTPGSTGQAMPVTDLGPRNKRSDQGVSVPTPNQQKSDKGKAASQKIQKPMMKAPYGLNNDELANLSALKAKYSKLKQTGGDPEKMSQLKSQIDQIMSTGEIGDVVRPGLRKGMVWGGSVWDGSDWVLPSQMVASAGDDAGD